jgi:hypothetical protein
MPRPRIAMRKIREVLRLVLGEGLSRHRAAAATGVPYTTVTDCLSRATVLGCSGPFRKGRTTGIWRPGYTAGRCPRRARGRSRTGLRSTGSCGARG